MKSLAANEKIKKIQSGWTHNGLQTDSGKIWLWGRNTYGQLADENIDISEKTLLLNGTANNIDSFSLGSEHGLAVTVEGQVFTWGWNEHSNCGNGNVENV